ncbi:MAG: hypothetical protein M1830_000482 [Pleopsidium flavum]|nr:MAG: hypothetical protein M1830_000482 [Pleopsidium flavum]
MIETVHAGIKVEKPDVCGPMDRTFVRNLEAIMRLDVDRFTGVGSEDAAAQTAYFAARVGR